MKVPITIFFLLILFLIGCKKETLPQEETEVKKDSNFTYYATLSKTQDCYEITVKDGVAKKAKKVDPSKCDGSIYFHLGEEKQQLGKDDIEKYIEDYFTENKEKFGPADNYVITKTRDGGTVKSFNCNGFYNKTTYTDYYNLEADVSGPPYKTCVSEVCQTRISNGIHYYLKNSGNNCINIVVDDVYCDNEYVASSDDKCVIAPVCSKLNLSACDSSTCVAKGFYWYNNNCHLTPQGNCSTSNLSACTTQVDCLNINRYWYDGACHASCKTGEVVTSRGCEVPVSNCTLLQKVVDNRCVDDYVELSPSTICGSYRQSRILIKKGTYYVTCDTTFSGGQVVVESGTTFEVDDKWYIYFYGIYAKGTSENPIIIKPSRSNTEQCIGYVGVHGGQDKFIDEATGQQYGNYLEYVNVEGLTCQGSSFGISNTFLENLNSSNTTGMDFNGGGVSIQDSMVKNSNITLAQLSIHNSFILNNAFKVGSSSQYFYMFEFNVFGSYLLWNNFTSSNPYSSGDLSTLNFQSSLFMFNHIQKMYVSYCYDSTLVSNNYEVFSAPNSSQNCDYYYNSATSFDNKAVVIMKATSLTESLSVNKEHVFSAYVFDKNGWVPNENITWKATYEVNGVTYEYPTAWTGSSVKVSFNMPESYKLFISSVTGYEEIIGKTEIKVNVQ